MQNYALFDPHQLDSDWRFDETTVKLLLAQSASVANLLLMGCPTISAALSGHVGKSVLLERNPNNFRTSKSTNIKTDLRFFSPRRYQFEAFDASIFDPPWYMAELFAWLNVAIWCTKKGGTIAVRCGQRTPGQMRVTNTSGCSSI